MRVSVTGWLLLSALCLPGTGAAQEEKNDTPQDFAYGMQLTTSVSAPFFSLNLPTEVYEQSVWPDLRDVRVFNAQGMSVPFALFSATTAPEEKARFSLRVYPLEGQKATRADRQVISLKSAAGLEITLPAEGDNARTIARSYLLEVPQQTETRYPRLDQIELEWERQSVNWQTRVNVLYSNDLKRWSTIADDMPLMDLASGGDRLLLNTLDLKRYSDYARARYLLLVFQDSGMPADLAIRAVRGSEAPGREEQRRIALAAQARAISPDEAEYTWSSPQPLSRLNIRPTQGNTVLPLEIAYRSSAEDSWHPLSKQVVYAVDDRFSPPIALNGQVVQGIKLKGVHQQWNEHVPQVEGERNAFSLAFNAQGSPPFLLAWGNRVAKPQAIDVDALIPTELRNQISLKSLPHASGQAVQTLGGVERLSAVDAAQRAALWQTVLLWGALLAGVGGLVLLALKVWREVQRKPD